MTNRETMELFIEKNGQETVAYPFVEKDHVVFGNGMGIEEVIEQDVTMPTVTHEEVSFKVGVGDQDVSSSIVDSSVGEMVIKGQTYQNILPEPSTHILTNDKEMFKVNEGLDSSVEIVDGVAKSAILKGQTLVNLVNDVTSNEVGNYNNSPCRINVIRNLQNETLTIIFNVISLEIPDGADGTLRIGGGWSGAIRHKPTVGINKVLYNCTQQSNNWLGVFSNSSSYEAGQRISISEVIVLEGDHTQEDIPYFEGMQSVKMPVLTTTGKNLLECIEWEIDKRLLTNGVVGESIGNNVSDYINVSNLDVITFSGFSKASHCLYDKDRNIIGGRALTSKMTVDVSGADYIRVTIDNTKDYSNPQMEVGSVATSYEPFRTNILTVNEDVTLRGIGNVKDELDCLTGEVTERIGNLQPMQLTFGSPLSINTNTVAYSFEIIPDIKPNQKNTILSNALPQNNATTILSENEGFYTDSKSTLVLVINKSRLTTLDKNGLLKWLTDTSCEIIYLKSSESIKTVDLSTSGNWEKIVLDGGEEWIRSTTNNNYFMETRASIIPNRVPDVENYFFHDTDLQTLKVYTSNTNIGICIPSNGGIRVRTQEVLNGQSLEEFKQWVSQNPITIWYQTTNIIDSTQVKQPIFFKDGHIQLSSGVDNSLIPTLDYQAKTSNSYVMDLMKTNTKYTMKAKTASGTFTIDGTSYGAGTNGTFTTPSSMTNKFLVMSDKTHEEVMIIEGDVVSKTIPYFKGIKSAFEDEDKIEVLSQNKNIFTREKYSQSLQNGCKLVSDNGETTTVTFGTSNGRVFYTIPMDDLDTTKDITFSIDVKVDCVDENLGFYVREVGFGAYYASIRITKTDEWHRVSVTVNKNKIVKDIMVLLYKTGASDTYLPTLSFKNLQIEYLSTSTPYEPYKSNSTKIPLLSPLRSLPNGVCDELIIDRMKKKATLIQRSESVIFNGSENWNLNEFSHDKLIEFVCHSDTQINHTIFSDRFVTGGENVERVAFSGGSIYVRISKTKVGDVNSFKQWLSQNPLTVQYGLNTPVVTEVDLEGFPYIYKDGHIFLNSEIAPTTQITYSISQQHQISASTQDLIRHEQELVYLYKLIAQYIQVDYQSTLLSLDLKLK